MQVCMYVCMYGGNDMIVPGVVEACMDGCMDGGSTSK